MSKGKYLMVVWIPLFYCRITVHLYFLFVLSLIINVDFTSRDAYKLYSGLLGCQQNHSSLILFPEIKRVFNQK